MIHLSNNIDSYYRQIDVNGETMGIVDPGQPEEADPKQPTLLLLHGFTGSVRNWDMYLERFTKAGIRAIAPDMPGHGKSSIPDNPERYSIQHSHADIMAMLQTLNIEPADTILIGYSMGGRIALYTTLQCRMRGLILESASAGLKTPEERAQRRASDTILAEKIEHEGIESFVNYWENIPLFASQKRLDPLQRQMLHKQRLNNHIRGLANSLRGVGLGAQPDLHPQLARLLTPTLLITGELDTKFSTLARSMSQMLPQAEWEQVAGAGHTVHLERPEQFFALIHNFYQTLVR